MALGKHAPPLLGALGSIVVVIVAAISATGSPTALAARQEPGVDADGWTADTCAECHVDEVEALEQTHHVALDREGLVAKAGVETSCAACHGDPSEHLATEGEGPIFAFDAGAATNAQRCLTCHADRHPRFLSSPHARAGLECRSCHAAHPVTPEPEPQVAWSLEGRPSATCAECHTEVFTEFTFTQHHRLEEGTLECTSCHDPHDRASRPQLAAFKQQTCVQCHQDKDGPFVFEHAASRVEGCTSCHSPHGSPNRHLLQFQLVAEQCFSCHVEVPGFHSRFTVETQCTNCHSQIHGSNLHHAFLQ